VHYTAFGSIQPLNGAVSEPSPAIMHDLDIEKLSQMSTQYLIFSTALVVITIGLKMAVKVWLPFVVFFDLFFLIQLIAGWVTEDIHLVHVVVVSSLTSLLLVLRAFLLLAFAAFGWVVVFTFWTPSPLAATLSLVGLCVVAWISTVIIPYWVARLRGARYVDYTFIPWKRES
jgi:hypothetical protein